MAPLVGADLERGTTVAGYRIEAPLGRGGMSVVYRAHDVSLDRDVALKLLDPQLAGDERFLERFLRESRVAAGLHHPAIVPVYAAGDADGRLYLAMGLVEGGDLADLLRRDGPLSPERMLALLGEVGEALDLAHRNGLVHRDVKPGNLLVDSDGRHAYLSDFGLTKSDAAREGSSPTGQLLGTIDYVAPEQIRGGVIDGRADVYSLGCVVYEALTGRPPFGRAADVAVIYAHLQDEAPPVSQKRPGLSRLFDEVLACSLAKNPDERYATAGEFIGALRAALSAGSDIPGRRTISVALATAATLLAVGLAPALAGDTHQTAAPPSTLAPYRATLGVRLTDGAPGSHPVVGLIAVLDNGRGPPGLAGQPPPTGEMVFRLDQRLTSDFFGRSSVLLGTPVGATVGYLTVSPGGGTAVQNALRKTGLGGRTAGEQVVNLAADVPAEFASFAGARLPVRVSLGSRWVTVTLDLQKIVRRASKLGVDASFEQVGVYFLGKVRALDNTIYGTFLPQRSERFRAEVSASPCVDRSCLRLGRSAEDAVTVAVPWDASVTAPSRAVYGLAARFTGTGAPGNLVSIAYLDRPGSGPLCTPTSVAVALRPCAPRYADAWGKGSDARARVGPDGHWALSVPLRSLPSPNGISNPHTATGRYVAVVHTPPGMHGTVNGGAATLFVVAPQTTHVKLAPPRLAIRRFGRRVELRMRVPGADNYASYEVTFRGRRVVTGRFSVIGTATATIRAPRRAGAFRVATRTWGADPSVSSVRYLP